MNQPVLIKVYGNFSPVNRELAFALEEISAGAMPYEPTNPPFSLKGDLCLLAFEGIYFPVDDFIQLLETNLMPQISGKLDYLDLENWRMTRYLLNNGHISANTVSLNHVLDYSGF